MGRRRVNDDPFAPLPKGLYEHRTRFRYRNEDGLWESLPGPRHEAIEAYTLWRMGMRGEAKSVSWLLDHFTVNVCADKVAAGKLAARTVRDYTYDAKAVKAGLGHIPYGKLTPAHIATYRDERSVSNPKHFRHELAALSSAFSWAVEKGLVTSNPVRQVRRGRVKKRERLISDEEFLTVYRRADPSVQLAMLLTVRTLALPGDVLKMGAANVRKVGERQVLSYRRTKVGEARVEIELDGELAEAIATAMKDPLVRFQKVPFVHTRQHKDASTGTMKAHAYTRDGIGSMFRRDCLGTRENPLAEDEIVADFGLRDLRAKGATDMYRAKVDIRMIQHLLGHKSVRTTEIYLKDLVPETVRPNECPIIAEAS